MKPATQYDGLRKSVAGWIETNQGYADVFKNWARIALSLGDRDTATRIGAALIGVETAIDSLRIVLEKADSALGQKKNYRKDQKGRSTRLV
jgi:hypothetical protein